MIEWYVKNGDQLVGPMSSDQLKRMAMEGDLLPDSKVRRGNDEKWHPAQAIRGLSFAQAASLEPTPPAIIYSNSTNSETHPCPFCAEAINVNAIKCKHCGEFLIRPHTAPIPQSPNPESSRPNLVQIVDKQKLVILAMLIGLIVELPLLFLLVIFPPLGLPLIILYAAFRTAVSIQLGLASFREPVIAVFLGLLTLIPLFGLFFLLVINRKATSTLKRFGVTVGLMGGNRTEAEQVQNNLTD
jgi:hypothetical protein